MKGAGSTDLELMLKDPVAARLKIEFRMSSHLISYSLLLSVSISGDHE